ncbi:RNB domain-containing ribonuclease [Pseudonocardia sp.]|uniref:RNB domain-containing ribonuclease n=1 Tax=Pseudonocardia sp. TaxID=60912 RepID=UPI003D144D38
MTAPDFAKLRAEFALPDGFPADVLAEAAGARAAAGPRTDATHVELVTIDPPGSRDLDQAVGVARRGDGFRVHYAIADVAAAVVPEGPLDAEARRRGQTVYLPDGNVPLHPPVLSEGAASLLPDGPRLAVLWTFDLDAAGEPERVDVRRATVRSHAQLTYEGVQADVDRGTLHPAIAALPELGPLRRAAAVRRGAVELELPEQEVVRTGDTWSVRVRRRLDIEAWNAEISLLTGMTAARMMLDAGVGLLRVLPAPDPGAMADLRDTARRLGVGWPEGASAAEVLSALPRDTPAALALRRAATSLLRGAGYAAFAPDGPPPPQQPRHGGIGAPYAHVTAPLRRLADRFGTEVCLAVAAGEDPAPWLRAALGKLPGIMSESDARANAVARACVDRTEAATVAGRLGERFTVVVLRAAASADETGEVYLADPPILARCAGPLAAGETVTVRLVAADPGTGRIEFSA